MKLDVCFSPDLLPLYDLRGRVAVIVDVLRATSTIVTALAQGVTEVFPTATLDECAALGRDTGCITAAERDGIAAEGFDLGNSPFGFLDGKIAAQGRDVLVVCAGWKGSFCLEDSLFGGALAERLAPLGFDIASSDAALAALHLWQDAKPTWPEYLLQSAAVRRLNALEAHDDFTFCMKVDTHPEILPLWDGEKLVKG